MTLYMYGLNKIRLFTSGQSAFCRAAMQRLGTAIQYHMQTGNHRGKSYTSTLKHFFSTVHVAWKEFQFSGVQWPNFSYKNSNSTENKKANTETDVYHMGCRTVESRENFWLIIHLFFAVLYSWLTIS